MRLRLMIRSHWMPEGDTTTVVETVAEAGERIAETAAETNSEEAGERVNPEGPREIVTDKGYHSKKVVSDLAEAGVWTYCSEPQRVLQRRHSLKEFVAENIKPRRVKPAAQPSGPSSTVPSCLLTLLMSVGAHFGTLRFGGPDHSSGEVAQ